MLKRISRRVLNKLTDNKISELVAERVYNNILNKQVRSFPKALNQSKEFKRLLEINTLDNQGGAAKVAYRLYQNLNQRNYDVKMIVQQSIMNEPNIMELRQNNYLRDKIFSFAERKKGWQDYLYLNTFAIKDTAWFQNADILHLHNLHGGYFSLMALPELTSLKPTVWTLHDMHSITGHCAHSFDCDRWSTGCGICPDLNIYPSIDKDTTADIWRMKKRIYDLSNLTIVCPSNWLKQKVSQSVLKEKEIHLIYNGIDTSIFKNRNKKDIRQILGLPLDKKILMFSAHGGSDNPWKGGQYLKDAYNYLQNRDDLLFLNVGGDQDKSLHKNWLDIPYVPDEETMAQYYAASDLFVYPSLADNCPLVVLEAMACGTPVISFETGGIPELVQHMVTGYLAKYKDLQDFIRGIEMFTGDVQLLTTSSQKATEVVNQRFTIEKMADQYLELYKNMLK